MKYRVLKPFINIDGAFLRINDGVSCTPDRAAILRKNNMIGGRMEYATKELPKRQEPLKEVAIEMKPKQKRRKRKS